MSAKKFERGVDLKEWEFNELTEYVAEVFNHSIDDGLKAVQAGGRCLYEVVDKIIKSFDFDNFVDELGITDAKDLSLRIDSLKTKMQNVQVIG